MSAGDLDYLKCCAISGTIFRPKTKEILELRPSDVTVALDEYLSDHAVPDKGDGSDPRLCPTCGTGRLSLKTGKFGAFVACSNYPECRYTRQFAGDGGQEKTGPLLLGDDPGIGRGGHRCARGALAPMCNWAKAKSRRAPRSPRMRR